MTCSTCNSPLPSDAHFCSRCGAHLTGVPAQPYTSASFVPVAYGRVSRHIQSLGILWLVYAVWRTATRFVGLAFLHGMFGWHHHANWGPWDGFGIWPLAVSSLVIGLVLSLLAAYALTTRQPWGRIIGIVCGIFALIHPVVGTALGIYTLWVLAPSASGYEYAEISARQVRA